MDLRSIANNAIQQVNPDPIVSVFASNGYTQDPDTLKQIPSYAAAVVGPAQVQALDGSELRHLDNLNIQGNIRKIYLRGILAGVIRPDSKGGDKVVIAAPAPPELIGVWLVTKMLETWPLWSCAAIVYQGAS